MKPPRPVEIIGGGLAGLSLGIALRHRGLPVTIREAGHYPRHRVCGEFITALDEETKQALHLAGPLRGARAARGVVWHEPGRPSFQLQLPEPALCLSRHRLDAALASEFTGLGGELVTGDRTDATPRPGRVLTCGRRPATSSPWLGLKQHFRGLPLGDDLELHLGRDAYVGLTTVENGTVNVCGLFPRQGGRTLPEKCRQAGLVELAGRLQDAEADEDSFCAVAGLDYDAPRRRRGPVPLGDAAGLIPPFTGHGMTIAWQSAAVALPHIDLWSRGATAWESAAARIEHDLRRRFRWRLLAGRVIHPWILRPARRRWFRLLHGSGLLPFQPLYRLLH